MTVDRLLLASRLLDVIENDIVPLTARGVEEGNKVFGAALLRKDDLSLVIASTNNETENPLWHGEVHCIKQFYELPDRPPTSDLIFLSTHEPCSLCLSAITWAGFDNFHFLFSHEDSRDSFSIPHDLRILSQVFGNTQYRRTNAFWTGRSIAQLAGDDSLLRLQTDRLGETYAELSTRYQAGKAESEIPLA